MLWLDDHLDRLVTKIHPSLLEQRPAMTGFLRSTVEDYLQDAADGRAPLADLHEFLGRVALGSVSAADYIEQEFDGLPNFLTFQVEYFDVLLPPAVPAALVVLKTYTGLQMSA